LSGIGGGIISPTVLRSFEFWVLRVEL
jgi:hypothetical protein